MSEIRDVILKKMRSLGLTIYQVAKLVSNRIPKRTVYAFLSGEKDTGTETASIIMQELGLTIKENPEKTLSIIK
jgi:predicted transcriptional regulator